MALHFSDRDRRQLDLMKERLLLYERDEIHLPTLIADIDFLIEAFDSVDPVWRQALREEWSVLEEVYAVALDRGHTHLDTDSERLVDRAVEALSELVAAAQQEAR
jgi:hypothetical protein